MTAPVFDPVPPPPPGPGVQPPFPAPPVEGKGMRIGLGLGIGAAIVVLVCGGGIAAAIGVGATTQSAVNEQAHVVIGDYFTALEQQKFDAAYGMLCPALQEKTNKSAYVSQMREGELLTGHKVGDVDLTSVELQVPVDVTYSDGRSDELQVYLEQSQDTGQFQVCGVE
jgi:hypothetical protein